MVQKQGLQHLPLELANRFTHICGKGENAAIFQVNQE